ncbi:conserved hypothetical protein [Neospora caninum Liverpool]|nr:conserved hypothetical protein [Neospora caninum Liverpool]CBZ54312.1 conserved hypothetical protein [Neospora caninum Liverpool]|eukprot:XP_003884343.1 conserved hypothetical protein [Neospora caninum Liverpool]
MSALCTSDSFTSLSRGRSQRAANSRSASGSQSGPDASPPDSHLDMWSSFQDPPPSGRTRSDRPGPSSASLQRVAGLVSSRRDGASPLSGLRDSHLDDWVSIQVHPTASQCAGSSPRPSPPQASAAWLFNLSSDPNASVPLTQSRSTGGRGEAFPSPADQLDAGWSGNARLSRGAGPLLRASLQNLGLQRGADATHAEAETFSAALRGSSKASVGSPVLSSGAGGVGEALETWRREPAEAPSRRVRSAGDVRLHALEVSAHGSEPASASADRPGTQSSSPGGAEARAPTQAFTFLEVATPGRVDGTSREEGHLSVGRRGQETTEALRIEMRPIFVEPTSESRTTPLSRDAFHSFNPRAVPRDAQRTLGAPYRTGELCGKPVDPDVYVHSAVPRDEASPLRLDSSGTGRNSAEEKVEERTYLLVSSGHAPERIVLLPRQLEELREEQKAIQRRQELRREQQALHALKMQEIERQQRDLQALMSRVRLEHAPPPVRPASAFEHIGAPKGGTSDVPGTPHSPQTPCAVSCERIETAPEESAGHARSAHAEEKRRVGRRPLCVDSDAVHAQTSREVLSLSVAEVRSVECESLPRVEVWTPWAFQGRSTENSRSGIWPSAQADGVAKRAISVPGAGELRYRKRGQHSSQIVSPAALLRSLSLSVRPDRQEAETGNAARVRGGVVDEGDAFSRKSAAAGGREVERTDGPTRNSSPRVCAVCEQAMQLLSGKDRQLLTACENRGRATQPEGDASQRDAQPAGRPVDEGCVPASNACVRGLSNPHSSPCPPSRVAPLLPSPRPASPPPRGPRLAFAAAGCGSAPSTGEVREARLTCEVLKDARLRTGGREKPATRVGEARKDSRAFESTSRLGRSSQGPVAALSQSVGLDSSLGPDPPLSFRPLQSSAASLSSSFAVPGRGRPVSGTDSRGSESRAAAERAALAGLTAHLLSSWSTQAPSSASLLSSLSPFALSLLSSLRAPPARLSGLMQLLLAQPSASETETEGSASCSRRDKVGASRPAPPEKKAKPAGLEGAPGRSREEAAAASLLQSLSGLFPSLSGTPRRISEAKERKSARETLPFRGEKRQDSAKDKRPRLERSGESSWETESLCREDAKGWERFFDGPLTLSTLDASSPAQTSKQSGQESKAGLLPSFDAKRDRQEPRRRPRSAERRPKKPREGEEPAKRDTRGDGLFSPRASALTDQPSEAGKAACGVSRQLLEVLVERVKQTTATHRSSRKDLACPREQGETDEATRTTESRPPESDSLAELLPLLLLLGHEALRTATHGRGREEKARSARERRDSAQSEAAEHLRGRGRGRGTRPEGSRENSRDGMAEKRRGSSHGNREESVPVVGAGERASSPGRGKRRDGKRIGLAGPRGLERERRREQRKKSEGAKETSAVLASESRTGFQDDLDFRQAAHRGGRYSDGKPFHREGSGEKTEDAEVSLHRERPDGERRRRDSSRTRGGSLGAGVGTFLGAKEERRRSRVVGESDVRVRDRSAAENVKRWKETKLRGDRDFPGDMASRSNSPKFGGSSCVRGQLRESPTDRLVCLAPPPGDVFEGLPRSTAEESALKEGCSRCQVEERKAFRRTRDRESTGRTQAAGGSKGLGRSRGLCTWEADIVGSQDSALIPLAKAGDSWGVEEEHDGDDRRGTRPKPSTVHLAGKSKDKKGERKRAEISPVAWKSLEWQERSAESENGPIEDRTTASDASRSSQTQSSSRLQEWAVEVDPRSHSVEKGSRVSRSGRSPSDVSLGRRSRPRRVEGTAARRSKESERTSFSPSKEKSERSGPGAGKIGRDASAGSPGRRSERKKKGDRAKKEEDERVLLALLDSIQLFVDAEAAKRAKKKARGGRSSGDCTGLRCERKGREGRREQSGDLGGAGGAEAAPARSQRSGAKVASPRPGGSASTSFFEKRGMSRSDHKTEGAEDAEKPERAEVGRLKSADLFSVGQARGSDRVDAAFKHDSFLQDAFFASGGKRRPLVIESCEAPAWEKKALRPTQEDWTESERNVEEFLQVHARRSPERPDFFPDKGRDGVGERPRLFPESSRLAFSWKEDEAAWRVRRAQEEPFLLGGKQAPSKLGSGAPRGNLGPSSHRAGDAGSAEGSCEVSCRGVARGTGTGPRDRGERKGHRVGQRLDEARGRNALLWTETVLGFGGEAVFQESDGKSLTRRKSSAGGLSEYFTPLSASAASFAPGVGQSKHGELRTAKPPTGEDKRSRAASSGARDVASLPDSTSDGRTSNEGKGKKRQDLSPGSVPPPHSSGNPSTQVMPTAASLEQIQSDAQALQRCLSYLRRLQGASRKCLTRASQKSSTESSSEESAAASATGARTRRTAATGRGGAGSRRSEDAAYETGRKARLGAETKKRRGPPAAAARRKTSIGRLQDFAAGLPAETDCPSENSRDDAELAERLSSSSASFPYIGLQSWAQTDVAE